MSDIEPMELTPFVPPVECWRCGKTCDGAATACPSCQAAQPTTEFNAPSGAGAQPSVRSSMRIADDPWSPIVVLIGYFAAMLIGSIVFGLIVRQRFARAGDLSEADEIWLLYGTLVFEAIDTIIVLAAWKKIGRPPIAFAEASPRVAWLAVIPALALLLATNFAYHVVLRAFLPKVDPERIVAGYEALALFVGCVQPAVIEELFFRGLALDWFRTSMTTRGALVVSSVMFGLMHVYVPASVPYLIVSGLVFGSARILSGGLLLPMILHFLHNLVVTLSQHYFT